VYAWIRRIPRGRVATYGQIARLAGAPRRARHVGQALADPPPELHVPWHRVVNAQGRISLRGTGSGAPEGIRARRRMPSRARKPAPGGPEARQRRLLEAEGVRFRDGRIDLERYRWNPALSDDWV
jgi:methylated-DNA-protein-cysteine methyltransferase-like protein